MQHSFMSVPFCLVQESVRILGLYYCDINNLGKKWMWPIPLITLRLWVKVPVTGNGMIRYHLLLSITRCIGCLMLQKFFMLKIQLHSRYYREAKSQWTYHIQ